MIYILGVGGDMFFELICVDYGDIDVFGFWIGDVVYILDVFYILEESLFVLENLDVFILDCLCWRLYFSYFNLDDVFFWMWKIGVCCMIFINMYNDLDYLILYMELLVGIELVYDGMIIDVDIGGI